METKHNKLPLRVVLAAAGMLLTGISIGFFKRSLFGVDPYQCFANGLANVIPIRFGTLYMLVNLVQLAVVFFLDRHYIGISTFLNMFLLGYIVEFSESLLTRLYPDPTLAIRIVFLIIGVVVTCIAAALYYTADLGVSTYDSIALHLDKKLPIPFKFIRICTDLICVGVGFVFGYKPGVGTIITAFFMGPLISLFNEKISKPLLYGKGGEAKAR